MELGVFRSEWLSEMVTDRGDMLRDLSNKHPVLLVFLRHFGCVFCREALMEISRTKSSLEAGGTRIVFVHMADSKTAAGYFRKFGLSDSPHISDPECRYYAAFGLVKGSLHQLFGLRTLLRGVSAGVQQGQTPGPIVGDGFQMPGVFVLVNGEVRESFIHRLSSDRPDYAQLASCCVIE